MYGLYLSIRQGTDFCIAWVQANQLGSGQAGMVALTLIVLRGTDGSFQPVPSMTIVLFVVTTLPHQVGLYSSIAS